MIQKVKRDNLSDQVTQGLIAFIDAQELSPGDSLPSENRLAEEFGASRPVIREALKLLQGEGLIEIVTGKNAVIKPISSTLLRKYFERAVALRSASFQHLIEVRRGLEIQSVMLAAERCSGEHIAALQRAFAQMRDSISDHAQFAEHDVQFHLLIASAACNPLLYYLIESIRDAMRDTVLRGLEHRFTAEENDRVQSCHDAILQALIAHDPQQARRAMEAHFDEAIKGIQ